LEDRESDFAVQKDEVARSLLRAGSGYNWLRTVSIDTPSIVVDSKLS